MNIKCNFMLHNWTVWKTLKKLDGSDEIMLTYRDSNEKQLIAQELIQTRNCVECNKLETRRIRL